MGPKQKKQIQPTKWLPKDQAVIAKWLKDLIKKIDSDPVFSKKKNKIFKLHPKGKGKSGKPDLQPFVSNKEMKSLGLHQPVNALYVKIITDPEINMFFHQMFEQQYENPNAKPEEIYIDCWQIFIICLQYLMTYTPPWSTGSLVGFPINALINWPMATTAGFACFLNDKVNDLFKTILNYWGNYLQTIESCSVLNDGPKGWFSEEALAAMEDEDGNSFETQFQCDKTQDFWGFVSWDDFFTRQFNDGMRPLTDGTDAFDIANACESAPFSIQRDVSHRSMFWIKQQPYSIDHMLNNNPRAAYYHGGTVYQAFLSATSYHRWHSPIDGTIVEIELIDGSYYSQTYEIQDDYASPNYSQGYISQVAARAVVYIKADNPAIGILGFVSIGMSEVSSNDVTVEVNQSVKKGQELGMFHFGGSTHCILYGPHLNVDFDISPNDAPGLDAKNIPLRRNVARVSVKPTKY